MSILCRIGLHKWSYRYQRITIDKSKDCIFFTRETRVVCRHCDAEDIAKERHGPLVMLKKQYYVVSPEYLTPDVVEWMRRNG